MKLRFSGYAHYFVAACFVVGLVLSQGSNPTRAYAAPPCNGAAGLRYTEIATDNAHDQQDTTLYKNLPNGRNPGADPFLAVTASGGQQSRAVIGFDLSALPADIIVHYAQLVLGSPLGSSRVFFSGSRGVSAYRLTQPNWSEIKANWNRYNTFLFGNLAWNSAGGDFDSSDRRAINGVEYACYPEVIEKDVATVTDWVASTLNGTKQLDLLLKQPGVTGVYQFKSSEASGSQGYGDRPALGVVYSHIISGYVFNDSNANGVRENGEVGVSDIPIQLKVSNTSAVAGATASEMGDPGHYRFFKELTGSTANEYLDGTKQYKVEALISGRQRTDSPWVPTTDSPNTTPFANPRRDLGVAYSPIQFCVKDATTGAPIAGADVTVPWTIIRGGSSGQDGHLITDSEGKTDLSKIDYTLVPVGYTGFARVKVNGYQLGAMTWSRILGDSAPKCLPLKPLPKFCVVGQTDSADAVPIVGAHVEPNPPSNDMIRTDLSSPDNRGYLITGNDGRTNPTFLEPDRMSANSTARAKITANGFVTKEEQWTFNGDALQPACFVLTRSDSAPLPTVQFKINDSVTGSGVAGARISGNYILGNPPNPDTPKLVTGSDGKTDTSHVNIPFLQSVGKGGSMGATITHPAYIDKSTTWIYDAILGQLVPITFVPAKLQFCARDIQAITTKIAGVKIELPTAGVIRSNPPNPDAPNLITKADGCTDSTYLDYNTLNNLVSQNQNLTGTKTGYESKTIVWQYLKQANQVVNIDLTRFTPPSADLSITKTFTDGSRVKTLMQGETGTYRLIAKNTSTTVVATDVLIRDIQSDDHPTTDAHRVAWLPNTAESTSNPHQLDWTRTDLQPEQTVTHEPEFIVRCNAPLTSPTSPLRNLALVTATTTDPSPANNTDNDLRLFIVPGDARLSLAVTSTPSVVQSGNSFVLSSQLTNNSLTTDARHVTLSTILPSQLRPQAGSTTGGGIIAGQKISWVIDRLAKGTTSTYSVSATVNQNVSAQIVNLNVSAVSLAADPAGSCGTASAVSSIRINGPLSTISKKTSTADVEKGEEFIYYVRLNNQGNSDLSATATLTDQLDPRLEFVRQDSCKVIDVTAEDVALGSLCGADQSPNPTVSGQTLSWSVSRVTANTAIVYPVVVKVRSTATAISCPDLINNDLIIDQGGVTARVSSGVNFYAAQCLEGNLYARNANARGGVNEGIKITGSDVIIAPQSVLASTQSIVCTSPKCANVPWKIANYEEATSVGLNFTDVKKRMERNSLRVSSGQTTLKSNNLSGGFNFYTGTNDDSYRAKAQFPEGRVWYTGGDLTIDTGVTGRDFVFTGKGTIIVGGNLYVTGQGKLKYKSESFLSPGNSVSDAVGFILANGNVSVGADVRQIVGAYYAPNGNINFDGPGTGQLRPANGIFIGSSINVDRNKVVFRYNNRLNSSAGAPPGFSFASSPGK